LERLTRPPSADGLIKTPAAGHVWGYDPLLNIVPFNVAHAIHINLLVNVFSGTSRSNGKGQTANVSKVPRTSSLPLKHPQSVF
jgi:hypothetical protein